MALGAPHTARELAQDGEPAPGSTTEPENATFQPAGVSEPLLPCPFCGGPARHSIIPDGGGNDVGGEFIYCFCCASSTGVSFRSREELFALWNRRPASQSQAILSAIAAEKAEWPHAGALHDGARMACDAIAARVKKLMGDA
jgi:hypothetical protein